MTITHDTTIILEVGCTNEECGMVSAYKFWPDGSYSRVLDACHHGKKCPTREQIRKAMESE